MPANVLKKLAQKSIPDCVNPEDTIPLNDLHDVFATAEVDGLIAGLSKEQESWKLQQTNAVLFILDTLRFSIFETTDFG